MKCTYQFLRSFWNKIFCKVWGNAISKVSQNILKGTFHFFQWYAYTFYTWVHKYWNGRLGKFKWTHIVWLNIVWPLHWKLTILIQWRAKLCSIIRCVFIWASWNTKRQTSSSQFDVLKSDVRVCLMRNSVNLVVGRTVFNIRRNFR